jgi:methylmalonyl-CoA mutase cobalamin-binding subunit
MKEHIVLKLHRRLSDDAGIPSWVDFITDKSVTREAVNPDVDRLLNELALKVWLTREYKPAFGEWNADEVREGLDRTYRMIFQRDYTLPDDLLSRLVRLPSVEMAHRLSVREAHLPAPALSTQTGFGAPSPAELIYLRYAQVFTKGRADVRIAILDTGLNLDHAELQGKTVLGADFVDLEGLNTAAFIGDYLGYDEIPEDEVGHGTHVAGIVAARGLRMDEGVCPGCRLMAVRVLATMRTGTGFVGAGIIDNINAGIKWAADHGADVINMSLGIRHTGGGLPHEDVIRYALAKNVTVVAASGNDGTAERYYPGALPGVIAVGAVDQSGSVAPFTSYGANITVVAPGVNVYSASARNAYQFASGTSQASPFVCGMVGLMKSFARQRGQTLTNRDVRDVLRHTSDRVDTRLRNEHAGYGLINMADAFKLLAYELA